MSVTAEKQIAIKPLILTEPPDFELFQEVTSIVDAIPLQQFSENRLEHLKKIAVESFSRLFGQLADNAEKLKIDSETAGLYSEIRRSKELYGDHAIKALPQSVHNRTEAVELEFVPPLDSGPKLQLLAGKPLNIRVNHDGSVLIRKFDRWEPYIQTVRVKGLQGQGQVAAVHPQGLMVEGKTVVFKPSNDAILASYIHEQISGQKPSDLPKWNDAIKNTAVASMIPERRRHIAESLPALGEFAHHASLYQLPEGASRLSIGGGDASDPKGSIFITAAGEIGDRFGEEIIPQRTERMARYLIMHALLNGKKGGNGLPELYLDSSMPYEVHPKSEMIEIKSNKELSVLNKILNPERKPNRINLFAYKSFYEDPGRLPEGVHVIQNEKGCSYILKRNDEPYSRIEGNHRLSDVFEAAAAEIYRKKVFGSSSNAFEETDRLPADFNINLANEWNRFCRELGDFRKMRSEMQMFSFPKEAGIDISQEDFELLWNWSPETRQKQEAVLTAQ